MMRFPKAPQWDLYSSIELCVELWGPICYIRLKCSHINVHTFTHTHQGKGVAVHYYYWQMRDRQREATQPCANLPREPNGHQTKIQLNWRRLDENEFKLFSELFFDTNVWNIHTNMNTTTNTSTPDQTSAARATDTASQPRKGKAREREFRFGSLEVKVESVWVECIWVVHLFVCLRCT